MTLILLTLLTFSTFYDIISKAPLKNSGMHLKKMSHVASKLIELRQFLYIKVWKIINPEISLNFLKGPVSGFVGRIPLPSLESIITRNH